MLKTLVRLVSAALLTVACAGGGPQTGDPYTPGEGEFGDRCEVTEDCSSGLCVRIDEAGGVCSRPCEGDAGCPDVPNWACVASDQVEVELCACRKFAETEICGDGLDNDCDGVADDCRMCDGQAVADDDLRHCGRCNNACGLGQSCVNGECRCPESAPDACSPCTDVETDPENCGECGTTCGAGQACVAGECTCEDASRSSFCEGLGCRDLATDPSSCGACGVACASAELCEDGNCVCPGGDEYSSCSGVGCVDTANDENHCGGCDNACSLGTICLDGECVCPDPAAPDFCGELGCIDLATSSQNCGACGESCRTGYECTDGACVCPPGLEDCDGNCVDTSDSLEHCGACGQTCGAQQACSDGVCDCTGLAYEICGDECVHLPSSAMHCGACGNSCLPGERCLATSCDCPSDLICDGECMPVDDPENCGSCGNACGSGQYCDGGECKCFGLGLSACGSTCQDLSYSEASCGECDVPCRTGELCDYGLCQCPFSESYCPAQGRCIDVYYDAANCGGCGVACKSGEVCDYGSCRCPTAGTTYCASANTCVNLQIDEANCGACASACDSGETCTSGTCACPNWTEVFCEAAGTCVDRYSDEAHCGQCGNACPTGTSCLSGYCACDEPGNLLCDGACVAWLEDEANCGDCGVECDPGLVCVGGGCTCPSPVVSPEIRVTNDAFVDRLPVAAWNGTHLGVAYVRKEPSGLGNLRFALVDPASGVISDAALTNYTGNAGISLDRRAQPALVWTGTEYGLLWTYFDPLLGDPLEPVNFLRLDENGAPKGAPVALGTGNDATALVWAPASGGYVAAWGRNTGLYGTLVMQELLLDGSAPLPERIWEWGPGALPRVHRIALATAPDGTLGLSFNFSVFALFWSFTPDLSRTVLTTNGTTRDDTVVDSPALIHDGESFVVASIDSLSQAMMLYRTSTQAEITLFGPWSQTNWDPLSDPEFAVVGDTLALAYLERPDASGNYSFRLHRYVLPLAEYPQQAHVAADIVAQRNVPNGATTDLVTISDESLMAVWVDRRWNDAGEIAVASIDVGSCP
jgi:hypothetical protein